MSDCKSSRIHGLEAGLQGGCVILLFHFQQMPDFFLTRHDSQCAFLVVIIDAAALAKRSISVRFSSFSP